jgi:hypothetical protein
MMREQEHAMRREAVHLKNERIALRSESDRLEGERIALQGESDRLEEERLALESATHRSEQERLRLERGKRLMEGERHLLERERGQWKRERERWEEARKDRLPQSAFWDPLRPSQDCRAYGRREYWGALQNIPEGWNDMEACTNMPAEIKDAYVRRPDRCGYVKGSPHIHGFWMVDWDQVDCKPWHTDATDKGCTNRGSRTRRIEAWVTGINDKPEQDWRLLCESTPFTWNHVTYKSPTHCKASITGKKYAIWDIPDPSC